MTPPIAPPSAPVTLESICWIICISCWPFASLAGNFAAASAACARRSASAAAASAASWGTPELPAAPTIPCPPSAGEAPPGGTGNGLGIFAGGPLPSPKVVGKSDRMGPPGVPTISPPPQSESPQTFEAYPGAADYSYRHFGTKRHERYSPDD